MFCVFVCFVNVCVFVCVLVDIAMLLGIDDIVNAMWMRMTMCCGCWLFVLLAAMVAMWMWIVIVIRLDDVIVRQMDGCGRCLFALGIVCVDDVTAI